MPSPAPVTPSRARAGALAVFAVFLLHGLMQGSWVARLPTVRGDLELTPSRIGLILLIGSCGNLTSMPVAGAVIQRFGTRRSLVVASASYAVLITAGCVMVAQGSQLGLVICLYLAQAASGVWTTTFNAASGRAERAVGRPIISRFHAGWSVGTVLAASVTTALDRAGVGLVAHLATVAALVLVANSVLTAWLLPDVDHAERVARLEEALEQAAGEGDDAAAVPADLGAPADDARPLLDAAAEAAADVVPEDPGTGPSVTPVVPPAVPGDAADDVADGSPTAPDGRPAGRASSAPPPAPSGPAPVRLPSAAAAWREPRTILIGLLLLACGLAEGSANDWIALGVTDDFGGGTNTALGTTGLTVFVSFMMLTRFLGTGVIARLGRVRTMRTSLVLASVGLTVFGLSPWLPMALVGIAMWAMGTALAFPLGMSAVSDDPVWMTVRVAVVSTIAYGASLAGPPVLGLIAGWIGYRHALLLIVLVLVPTIWIVPVLAPSTGPASPSEQERPAA
ncbi:hypothetical protein AXF14_05365 [Actinomyces radicidentis]|uniref:MFS transporter n=1 Tax=Actinomyces radicidentis TaxID=111015 RepID=A0A120KMG8_ACTRD|nr:MFS transporter [Actinomyces radicidentis]AMD87124.1 hypothetical protein AXF14_05365 [Actinomyces radicidentis]